MSDAHPHDHEAPEVALARHVDAICRRFEADWRAGRIPAISDYLGEIAEEGRAILRAELEALESELRQADEATRARARLGRRGSDRRTEIRPLLRSRARRDRRSTRRPPCRRAIRPRSISDHPDRSSPMPPRRTASATSATTSCSARSPAAAWASSTRRGRSA